MINLTIDSKAIAVPEGTTVLEAARQLNIDIPTLCYDERLKPYGGCRLCIVEIAGLPKPVTSCTTPVAANMVVTTNSERLYRLRRTTIELLLSDHPNDCMVCIKTGDCTLQELAYLYDIRSTRFQGEMRKHDRVDANPFIQRDQNKCVMCGLCVRVCHEIQGVGAIEYSNRGFHSKVSSAFEKDLNCEFCGQCVSICPTGALSGKMWAGLPRSESEGVKLTESTCTYCGCGCNITLHSHGNTIIRVSSKPTSHNRGWLCVKGRFGYDFINSADRLTTPLIRRNKGGKLEPATWDEALDVIATRMNGIKEKYGPDALAGLASARCTNEENYLFQKLFRKTIGTNNVDHCARY
jgi:predicted molibdopterin-dependent oxidoreductase YjgC